MSVQLRPRERPQAALRLLFGALAVALVVAILATGPATHSSTGTPGTGHDRARRSGRHQAQHRDGDGRRHARRRPAVHARGAPAPGREGADLPQLLQPVPAVLPGPGVVPDRPATPTTTTCSRNASPYGFGGLRRPRDPGHRAPRAATRPASSGSTSTGTASRPPWSPAGLCRPTCPPAGRTGRRLIQATDAGIGRGGTYNYFHPMLNINGRVGDSYGASTRPRCWAGSPATLVTRYRRAPGRSSCTSPRSRRTVDYPLENDDIDHVRRDDGVLAVPTPARPAWVRGPFDRHGHPQPGLPADGGRRGRRLRQAAARYRTRQLNAAEDRAPSSG